MLKYAWLTIKHKYFVLLAGLKIGCPLWRLITHDLSKFTFSELPHYQRQFFGKADDPQGFVKCWLHHQNKNDHHWEYWVPRTGNPPYKNNEPLPMPDGAILEMIADWIGAGRAYNGKYPDFNNWIWWENNKDKVILHGNTREIIEDIITGLGKQEK